MSLDRPVPEHDMSTRYVNVQASYRLKTLLSKTVNFWLNAGHFKDETGGEFRLEIFGKEAGHLTQHHCAVVDTEEYSV
jgi:hypothetical protein